MSIVLHDLVRLARSYFKAVSVYNHDAIDVPNGEHDDIKHESSANIAQGLIKAVENADTSEGTVCFVVRDGNGHCLLVSLDSNGKEKIAYVNGELAEDDSSKKAVYKTFNIVTTYDYDAKKKKLTVRANGMTNLSLSDIVVAPESAANIVCIMEDDHKYSQWNKVTRRILVNELEAKDVKVSYCRQNFMLDGEEDLDIDLPTGTFVYNRTDFNETFDAYPDIAFYGLFYTDDEVLYSRFEKHTQEDGVTLAIGEGIVQHLPVEKYEIKDGKISVTLEENSLFEGTFTISILFVIIAQSQIELASRYDIRKVLYSSNGLLSKSRYISRVTKEMVRLIPDYKKFDRFDIEPIKPDDSVDAYRRRMENQLNMHNTTAFYGLDVDTSVVLLQADNTTQDTTGYGDIRSGLTLRYIDANKEQQSVLLPSDLEKACYIDEKRLNQYMCGDYDYVTADCEGLVFNSTLVRALDAFNYSFVMDSGDKVDTCNINAIADNEARIPFNLLCSMRNYRYFLSDCYKDKFSIPVGEDGNLAKFDMFTPHSINADYTDKKTKDIDTKLTFNTLFSQIRRLGYERWMVAFQLNLTNIDATDKDTVYFDSDVKYGETRHVYVYIVRTEHPFVIFKHSDIDGTEITDVASISLIKLNDYDAIECKTADGERFVISGSDKNGKVYFMRGGALERAVPINALADFDKRNESYNVYRCNIAALYVDYSSKKKEKTAEPRGAADEPFINIFVPNIDIRLNDHQTVNDFYNFCTEQLTEYRARIAADNTTEEIADPAAEGGYQSIGAIYTAFKGVVDGVSAETDYISPIASLYLFIGIEYTYTYATSSTSRNVRHFFSKMIQYKIDRSVPFTENTTSGTDYKISDVTVKNLVTYTSADGSTYTKSSYDYERKNTTAILINQEGATGSETYTIDFGSLAIDTLENMIKQGDLDAVPTDGSGKNDIADYLENNGINMYQVNTNDGTTSIVFPIDFTDRDLTSATTTTVKVNKFLIKCIPTKPK